MEKKNAWVGDLLKAITWMAIFVAQVNFYVPIKTSCWAVLVPMVILYATEKSLTRLAEVLFIGTYFCMIIFFPANSLWPQFVLGLMFSWSICLILTRLDDKSDNKTKSN